MLDPFSPTLITDWASSVLGRPMHRDTVQHMQGWLQNRKKEFQASRLHRVTSPFPDVLLLATTKVSSHKDHYFMSWQGSQLYDIKIQSNNTNNKKNLLYERVKLCRSLIQESEDTGRHILNFFDRPAVLGFTTLNNVTFVGIPKLSEAYLMAHHLTELGLEQLPKAVKPTGHNLTSSEVSALTDNRTQLKILFRKALRAPQVQIIRQALATADPDALQVMRRIHNFNNLLYGYMVSGPDPGINLRRRRVVQTFPALARFTYQEGISADHLRRMVDDGISLMSGHGLQAVVKLLSEEAKVPISARTAKTYARLQHSKIGHDIFNKTTKWLAVLDAIDPVHWPKTADAFAVLEAHLGKGGGPSRSCASSGSGQYR